MSEAPQRTPNLVDLRLRNGARVLVLPLQSQVSSATAVQLWIGAGTSAESATEHGCAHLLEHMLFKPFAATAVPRVVLRAAGLSPSAPVDLTTALEALGGDANAATSHDETIVYVTVPAHAAGSAVALMCAATLQPTLDPKTLTQEREVVIEEILQYADDPYDRVPQAVHARVFDGDPYARPVLGTVDEVSRITASRLRGFHRRIYAGSRVTLVVVGPVDPQAIVTAARKAMAKLPVAKSLGLPPPVTTAKPHVHVVTTDVSEVHVMLGWLGCADGHPHTPALDVAGIVLGSGEASRLACETRRRDQLVSDVSAGHISMARGGLFRVSALTTTRQANAAVIALLKQVERLCQTPLSPTELARARTILHSDRVYRRETVDGYAQALGYYATHRGDLDVESAYHAALDRLTPEAVLHTCAQTFGGRKVSASIELPRSAGKTRKQLAKTLATTKIFVPVKAPKVRHPCDDFGVISHAAAGLRVRAYVDRSVPVASGWLVWPGGQYLDPAAKPGIAAMIATLLTRGDAQRSGDDISALVDARAASFDGMANNVCLGLHWECLADDLPTLLELVTAAATRPRFAESELQEARRVTLQALEAAAAEPEQVAYEAMLGGLYNDHPMAWPVRGTPAGLKSLTRSHLQRLWTTQYPLYGAVLGLAGDFDVDAVMSQLARLLPEFRRPTDPKVMLVQPAKTPKAAGERTIFRPREQAYLALGFPALGVGDAALPVLDLLLTVLGSASGRLFAALREQEGLVYTVSCTGTQGLGCGHVTIRANTGPDKLQRVRAAISRELHRIVHEKIPTSELDRARAMLIGQHEASQQRRSNIAATLAVANALGLAHSRYFLYPKRLAAVRSADLSALAAKIFNPNHQFLTVVRPR